MQTEQEEKKKKTLLSNLKKKGLETWALQGGGEQQHKLRLKNFLKAQTVSCPVERACERQREEDLLY